MNFINEFHKDGSLVRELNRAFIAIIPKVGNLMSMKDFKPISLVSSMYKMLAKVLANRLRKVMNSIIGESQMAFVENRQSSDSLVIAEEIIHKWRSGDVGGMLVKLDFEKAYDSVDHVFLDSMLEGMGFGRKWLDLISGESFNDDSMHITHLQFANDTILFLKPKIEYLLNAKQILRCFELASGLKVNFHKSCVVRVGRGISNEVMDWAAVFKCKKASLPIPFLGFPLGGRPGSKAFWDPLVDKIEKRLAPWKRKFLYKGGRLVLIKAVISSIPIYFLLVFKIPVSVANRIEMIQRSFLWGDNDAKRKFHAVRWVDVCKRKGNSGLGIERILDKNKALLAKWMWRKWGMVNFWSEIKVDDRRLKDALPRDTIVWSVNSDGLFTVGSFRRSLEDALVDVLLIPKLLWKGLCPPKVDVFMWQLRKGRIIVKELLIKFVLWRLYMNWWGVQCCLNNSVKLWLEEWSGLCPAFQHERAWNSLFCAIAWSIWESGNNSVFENIELDVVKVSEVVKFRVVWWFKNFGKGSTEAIQSLLINFKDFCIDHVKTKKNRILDWKPPTDGKLKFNVDRSILGKSGPAGVGGVLRDSNWKILCLFSYHLGTMASNEAEIMAIKIAVGLFSSNLMEIVKNNHKYYGNFVFNHIRKFIR
ncbi:hypothetical protein Ddye_001179 [Dipteronia dyeriana]|uniref:Reverse transcriptase domain-containing protein n=1 Tax=Dipteronia dyeriana TaxID=168575 RepID=A0AAE0CT27_9ROSI|nr:hypothetical protein Ddye_001179 [Dipteronia dyeriana]